MTTPDPNVPEQDAPEAGAPTPPSKIYVLLDRSGSMSPMVDDVLGGFNNLLAELTRDGSTATVTLVQFDSGSSSSVNIGRKLIYMYLPSPIESTGTPSG